ncbi:hypothetical protein ACWGJQ_20685 [Peribacillus simplex]
MRQLGCLELKNAKIPVRKVTNKKDRPPCNITFDNEPDFELMAMAFATLCDKLIKKEKLIDKPWLDEE